MPTKTLFLILAPRPLSTRLGAFFYPKHFPANFFRNFFHPRAGELFSIFMARKIMRVKGTCRSANGGGCPSFMPFLHIAKGLPSCLPSSSPVVNFQPIGANFRQKVAKVNFSLVCLGVLSGFSETKKGKSEIYFGFEDCRASVVALHLWRWWCPLGAGGALLLPLFGCVPSLFSLPLSLSCFACGALHLNMALFRVLRVFLAGFGVRMYVCIG